jgi:tetratricopeptide (TPR) repeat protein
VSLEAAFDRETAEELLLDRTGNRPSVTDQLLRPPAERVTSLYRIGRGLLSAGRPLEAVTLLEQALEKAKTASPGDVIEQSITLNLALALARTLPSPPEKQRLVSPNTYSYFLDAEVVAYVDAVVRVRALVHTGIGSSRTAAVCAQAARILLLTGDAEQAVSLFKEAIKLDPRLVEAYLGLGSWYSAKGMIILARELYEEGVGQLPADPQIAGAYAIASYETLPPENALPPLERASQMNTRDPYLFAHLGDCYADLGLTAKAQAAYEEGLRRTPGAKPLLDRLAKLSDPIESLP